MKEGDIVLAQVPKKIREIDNLSLVFCLMPGKDIRILSPTLILINGKGRKQRRIPIHSVIRREVNNFAAAVTNAGYDFVAFTNRRPRQLVDLPRRQWRLNRNALNHILRRFALEADVDPAVASCHKWRRRAASSMHKAGTPIDVVRAVLGHEDIRTTQIYLSTETEQRTAAI